MSAPRHFYIHIPFCTQKCAYCKFSLRPKYQSIHVKKYLHTLKKEISNFFQNTNTIAHTLYFGGGTPSILSPNNVQEIISLFPNIPNEISFEVYPKGGDESYFIDLFSLGINRISIGVQSLSKDTLKSIGRNNPMYIWQTLSSVEKALLHFPNNNISVNIDVILGLPYATAGSTMRDIQTLHTAFPWITHTSVYILENERYPENWKHHMLKMTTIQQEHQDILHFMEYNSWHHYEISNFAKPGYECQHNCAYWDHSEYVGFGLDAASYYEYPQINGEITRIRSVNAPSFEGYYRKEKTSEILSSESYYIEVMMFALRTKGYTPHANHVIPPETIQKLLDLDYISYKKGKITVTKTGIFFIDYIISELL